MTNTPLKNPIEQLASLAETSPNAIFLRQPTKAGIKEYSFKEVYEESKLMASALNKKGLKGKNVAILSKNCAHWMISDFSIFMSGAISVPLLPTYSKDNLKKILEHADVQVIFCGKLDKWKDIKEIVPTHVTCIAFPNCELEGTVAWDDYIKENSSATFVPEKRSPEELATIIYTSGSTGSPKGVMHNFAAATYAGNYVAKMARFQAAEKIISYLPLGHVAERALSEFGGLYGQVCITFVDSVDSFAQTMKDVGPDVFLAVPRIWQNIQGQILKKIPQKKLDLILKIPVVSTIFKNKVKEQLGLKDTRMFLSGAAPVAAAVVEWYKKLGIVIREGYGMTETFAYAHFSVQNTVKDGTVGQALVGVESKLSESGELLVKSPTNMTGFYKSPELTAEAFDGEFLKTGDLGALDADGFLKITGRCKELFKSSKGKYIVPSKIEAKYMRCEMIDNICVVGEGLPSPVAVLNLNHLAKGSGNDNVKKELLKVMNEVNSELEGHEKVAKLYVSSKEWTIESGMMTPTLKIKRNEIEKFYNATINQLAADRDKVVFIGAN